MKKLIVSDYCAEINEKMEKQQNIKRVPFFIDIEDKSIIADDRANIDELIELMNNSKEVVKTAAPTPEYFYEAAKGYDEVYFVTISSKLSATYNSATIAKTMLEDENPNAKIHVFDSKSAACGETQVINAIQEQLNLSKTFEQVVDNVTTKIEKLNTIFVLENLDNLIKNGRMSKVAGMIASALKIYPVCVGVDGVIEVKHKPRGIKSALTKMVSTIGELTNTYSDKILYITHIRNEERAKKIKEMAEEVYDFKSIEILEGTALSTTYANKNGIILAF
ncbi:DegV family protein [Helcococcus bovis]|uniref:DegV family protein n=1 Tax=Helcococcus bovis TaxID=3153252 RepID=A0ABW9F6Y7_9FIRM